MSRRIGSAYKNIGNGVQADFAGAADVKAGVYVVFVKPAEFGRVERV